VNSIIIQGVSNVCHPSHKGHRSPEFPIAAEAEAFVRPTDPLVSGLSEKDATGVEHGVQINEIVAAFLPPVKVKVIGPFLSVHIHKVGVRITVQSIICVDTPRSAINKYDFGVGIKDCHQSIQQFLVGVVVGLCNPDVFTVR
jgi:hypothetical protein